MPSDAIKALLEVQALDKSVAEKTLHMQQMPKAFAEVDAQREVIKTRLDAAKAALKQLEVDRQAVDVDLKSQEALLVRLKNHQLEVKKQDEYEALLSEMEAAQTAIVDLEDREIQLLMEVDEARDSLGELEAACAKELEAVAREKSRLQGLQSDEKSALESLRSEWEHGLDALDADLKQAYLSVKQQGKKWPYVAAMHAGSCQGCHLKLSGETLGSLNGPKGLAYCEHCGRFLYKD